MPAAATHYLLAKQVLSSLDSNISTSINKTAFYWGAQGPDFFFSHRFSPFMKEKSLQQYGDKIHAEKPSKIFKILREYIDENPNPIYRSYILGFVCHYALDAFANPYVNWLTNELLPERIGETETTIRGEIESSIDSIMIRSKGNKLPTEVKFKKFYPKDETSQRAIADIYKILIKKLFDDEVETDLIYQATKDMHKSAAFLTDRTTMKQKIIGRFERNKPKKISSRIVPLMESDNVDYANISEDAWGKENCKDSFFDLFDEAETKAEEIINNFNTCDFAVITEERFFCG